MEETLPWAGNCHKRKGMEGNGGKMEGLEGEREGEREGLRGKEGGELPARMNVKLIQKEKWQNLLF